MLTMLYVNTFVNSHPHCKRHGFKTVVTVVCQMASVHNYTYKRREVRNEISWCVAF